MHTDTIPFISISSSPITTGADGRPQLERAQHAHCGADAGEAGGAYADRGGRGQTGEAVLTSIPCIDNIFNNLPYL